MTTVGARRTRQPVMLLMWLAVPLRNQPARPASERPRFRAGRIETEAQAVSGIYRLRRCQRIADNPTLAKCQAPLPAPIFVPHDVRGANRVRVRTWTSIPKITPDTVIPCHPRESGEKAGIQLQPAYVFVPDGVLAHMDFFSENNARSKTGTKASPKGRPLLRTCSLVCSAPLQQCIEFYISPACLSWGCILMRDGSYVIRF